MNKNFKGGKEILESTWMEEQEKNELEYHTSKLPYNKFAMIRH